MVKVNHHEGSCCSDRVKLKDLKEKPAILKKKKSFLQESSHSVRSFSGDPEGFSSRWQL